MAAVPSSTSSVRATTLSNGIQVFTEAMPHMHSVAVGYWIGTGSRSESPADNGISHFIEHMLFKGTSHRSAEAIAREADSIGGHLDAFTGKELVGYTVKVLAPHVERGFDILSDLVLNPLFRPEDVEKERGVILEELKMDRDNPESQLHEIFMSNFYKRHPLGRPILGSRRTIQSFDAPRLRAYHEQNYSAPNLTVTAAGHLEHGHIVELVEQQLGGLAVKAAGPAFRQPQAHADIDLRSKRSLQQVHLCLGVPCYPAPHPRRYACYLMSVILGGGMSSRLFQTVREQLGLVYSIFSELNMYKDSGSLGIYAGASSENVPRVVEAILAEFRALKNELVTDEELRRAKDHLKGSMVLSLESTTSRMSNLARQYLTHGCFFSMEEIQERVEAVSAEEIQQVATEFLQPDRITAAMLGRLDGIALDRGSLAC